MLDKLNVESSPVENMRNGRRILNHAQLLKEKVSIGKKYGLISSAKISEEIVERNLQLVKRLLARQLNFASASLEILKNLAESGVPFSQAEFEKDLWSAFRVGLLEYHITDCCDLGCPHCFYGSSGNGATIPFPEVSKLKYIQPQAVVITGGGEPTLYNYEGRKFADVIQEIRTHVPGVQLGLQTNGTVVPKGNWSEGFLYARSSVDADNPDTYIHLKSKPFFERVVRNLIEFARTSIPYVGVGFLFEKQNIDQIPSFISMFHNLIETEAPAALEKFTIQFRPLGPDITILRCVRDGKVPYPVGATEEQIATLKAELSALRQQNPKLAKFMDRNTNLGPLWEGNSGHPLVKFKHCYVSQGYRMIRAGGNNFPCFILVQHEQFCLGNFFGKDPEQESEAYLSIALCAYHFFNCRTEYCNACFCRQSPINSIAEQHLENPETRPRGEMGQIYFF